MPCTTSASLPCIHSLASADRTRRAASMSSTSCRTSRCPSRPASFRLPAQAIPRPREPKVFLPRCWVNGCDLWSLLLASRRYRAAGLGTPSLKALAWNVEMGPTALLDRQFARLGKIDLHDQAPPARGREDKQQRHPPGKQRHERDGDIFEQLRPPD